jgi:phosphotransferase system  glucose/maltose/N-acetylglucosamine-specific IIC component
MIDVIFCIAVKISAQPGVKGWFSDKRHTVLYAVMGLVIVILFVIILWLLHDNR